MSQNWGPHYIVPSDVFTSYSGTVQLREEFDEDLLSKELEDLGLPKKIVRITNPWYYRKKGARTWVKIGESRDKSDNFAVAWDTLTVRNGQYEVIGLMHVFVKNGGKETGIAGQNIVEVNVEN